MASNFLNTDQYYKVSFITTHSQEVPKKLKQTGALVVMDNVQSKRKSLWFRGELIASGYGFIEEPAAELCTYFIENVHDIFGGYNGLYDFCPDWGKDTYTGNQSYLVGKSVYARFNDLWNSYNDLHSYTTETLGYTGDWLNRCNTYLLDSYSYTSEWITNNYEYFDTAYSYLIGAYAYTIDLIDSTYSYTQNYIYDSYTAALAYSYVMKDISYAYTGEMVDLMHKYVDRSIFTLVGGAPETLDSLGEIANYLSYLQTNGLHYFEILNDLAVNSVRHEKVLGRNTYAYIQNHTYSLELEKVSYTTYQSILDGVYNDESSDGLHKGLNWWVEEYVAENGQTEYSYCTYIIKESDTYLGIKSDLVSATGVFQSLQLTEVLKKIIPPYPYKKPEVFIEENNVDNIKSLGVFEYGTTQSIKIKLSYNLYDSPSLNVNYISDSGNTQEVFNYYGGDDIWHNLKPGSSIIPDYQDNSSCEFELPLIFDKYPNIELGVFDINYQASIRRNYPAFYSGNMIPDNEHSFEGGNFVYNRLQGLKIPVRYPLYYKIYNTDDSSFSDDLAYDENYSGPIEISYDEPIENNFNKILITENEIKSNIFNQELKGIKVLIPKELVDNLNGIKIQNYLTGVYEVFGSKYDILNGNYKVSNHDIILRQDGLNLFNDIEYVLYTYERINGMLLKGPIQLVFDFMALNI